ncbi:MAG: MFS transporter [Proteobacteria bacterium]|nr:MFS transporter [Pseudomonadota bacterium]
MKFLPFLFVFSLIASSVEIDISVPSFPDLAQYFAVPDSMVQLTIALNFLGFFIASLIYGPLSESFGRRKSMLLGNALLAIGALGCVFAPSISWLLAARFIQGLGASASAVIVFAMIADVYKGKEAVKLIGMMNALLTVLISIAPVMGGFINEAIGWRGNYGIVAAICVLSWLLIFAFLPETKEKFTPLEVKKILKDYRLLLGSKTFLSASMAPSLLYCAYLAFVACAAFLYMQTFALSMMAYTLHQATIVAFFSFTSFFSQNIINKFSTSTALILFTAVYLIGALLLVAFSFIFPLCALAVTLSMILIKLGFAICYSIIFAKSLEIFPHIKGTASSVIMSMRALLCAGFVWLASVAYNGQVLSVALVVFLAVTLAAATTVFAHSGTNTA